MPLPTVNVTITALQANNNGTRAGGTFARGNPFPGWAQMNESGDIDLTGAPDAGRNGGTAVSIAFTLDDTGEPGLTFATENAFVPPENNSDFGTPVLSDDNKTVTVTDANNEARFTQLEYNLTFSDGSVLDPRMINR